MKSFFPTLFVALFALPAVAEVRTWTDSRGLTIEAEMLGTDSSASGPTVRLKLADGRIVAFPFRSLSAEDQKYVQSRLPADPSRAAAQIDQLILLKLKSANDELKEQLRKVSADSSLSPEDKAKKIEEIEFRLEMTIPTDRLTDEQFLRRAYLNIGGRIPTYEEAVGFLESNARDKRAKLIDHLLNSEAFVSHMFNQLSDLLRIRSQLTMNMQSL